MQRFVYFNVLKNTREKMVDCEAIDILEADQKFTARTGMSAMTQGIAVCPLALDSTEYRTPEYLPKITVAAGIIRKVTTGFPKVKIKVGSSAGKNKRLRAEIIARDGLDCCWCGEPCLVDCSPMEDAFATLEHIKRKFDGGTNARENLAIAHRYCNNKRHSPKWKPGLPARSRM